MSIYNIGISCFYHDSAAVLICNDEIISAVQEERFTRKNDPSFPRKSIEYLLKSNNINLNDVNAVIYYEKPLLTYERLLETYLSEAPRGIRSFIAAMKVWLKEKLFLKVNIKKELENIQKNYT